MTPTSQDPAQDQERASAQERISHATLELIAEQGLSEVTMSAVAKRAGVARQTLYNHYPDIDTIIGTVIDTHQTQNLQVLNATLLTMSSPLEQLAHLVRHTAAIAQHGHPMIRRGFSASVQTVLDHHDHDIRTVVEGVLRRGIAAGEMRGTLQPERDALPIQRMIEAIGELVVADPADTAEIVEAVIATVQAAVTEP